MDYYEKYIKYKKKYTIIRNQIGGPAPVRFKFANLDLGLTFDNEEEKQRMVVKNDADAKCSKLTTLLEKNYTIITEIKSSEGYIYISNEEK